MTENLIVPGDTQILIYQSDSGETRLEVRLEDETVWLTQNLMAELYETTKQNISLHIQNIFEEGELAPEATVKKYLTVRPEGSRTVRRLREAEAQYLEDLRTSAKVLEGRCRKPETPKKGKKVKATRKPRGRNGA